MRLCTLPKSISRPRTERPKARACAIARACLAAAISDFDGTQPVLRHSPPILPCSMRTTGTRNAAAAAATESPPEPPPMTQISGVRTSVMSFPPEHGSTVSAPASHCQRDKRKNAKHHQRTNKLGREGCIESKRQPAAATAARKTCLVGSALRHDRAVEAAAD